MGKFKKITRPETLKKVQRARHLFQNGKPISLIAKEMGLSVSRIRELLKGVNWYSGG